MTIQPYLTWATDQSIRSVRLLGADAGSAWTNVAVFALGGTLDPTVEGNWSLLYNQDFGSGQTLVDINLGSNVVTRGLRVRTIGTTTDMSIGEIEVYGQLVGGSPIKVGSLADGRVSPLQVNPTGFVAHSPVGGTSPSCAGKWGDQWLSLDPASNPGDFFYLDRTNNNLTVHMASIAWKANPDNGARAVPLKWTLQADTGSGFFDLGTY